MNNIIGKTTNYYKLLNLKKNASEDDIMNSYSYLSSHWDPTKNSCNFARERFTDISKAYYILSNKNLRRKYDILYKNKQKLNIEFDFNNALNVYEDFLTHNINLLKNDNSDLCSEVENEKKNINNIIPNLFENIAMQIPINEMQIPINEMQIPITEMQIPITEVHVISIDDIGDNFPLNNMFDSVINNFLGKSIQSINNIKNHTFSNINNSKPTITIIDDD